MRERVKSVVYKAMEEMNLQLDAEKKLQESDTTVIYGEGGILDSMDFVGLICIVEDHIFREFNKSVSLVSEKAFSKKYNPFKDVNRLTDFIVEILEGEKV